MQAWKQGATMEALMPWRASGGADAKTGTQAGSRVIVTVVLDHLRWTVAESNGRTPPHGHGRVRSRCRRLGHAGRGPAPGLLLQPSSGICRRHRYASYSSCRIGDARHGRDLVASSARV